MACESDIKEHVCLASVMSACEDGVEQRRSCEGSEWRERHSVDAVVSETLQAVVTLAAHLLLSLHILSCVLKSHVIYHHILECSNVTLNTFLSNGRLREKDEPEGFVWDKMDTRDSLCIRYFR